MKKLSFRLADGCRHIKRLGTNSNADHDRNHRANAGDLRHRSQLTGAGVWAVGRALCAGHGREDQLHGKWLVSGCESVQSGSADLGTVDIPISSADCGPRKTSTRSRSKKLAPANCGRPKYTPSA